MLKFFRKFEGLVTSRSVVQIMLTGVPGGGHVELLCDCSNLQTRIIKPSSPRFLPLQAKF